MTPDESGGTSAPAMAPEVAAMVHPQGVQNGVMWADPGKCTGCGRCLQNCPYKCWVMGADDVPTMKERYLCFSCGNCIVACGVDAISMVRPYAVHGGYFDTDFPAYTPPLPPRDAAGDPAEWTETERIIIERRSVRHYKNDPVPETLIRRVLEAGRFAPSGGNSQPWKFTVVTDPAFIAELEEKTQAVWAGDHFALEDEAVAASLVGVLPDEVWDPRVRQGLRSTALKELAVFLDAPVVIFMGANKKMALPILQAGICGQNMNLAAIAIGLGFVWTNFGAMGVERTPELKARLGFDDSWTVAAALCLGYPSFTQRGLVARQNRPVTWFRPGAAGPVVES
jgi:nitroreductase/NAD-dependent dihydropyrimidine dehydrogenase PreA subunit